MSAAIIVWFVLLVALTRYVLTGSRGNCTFHDPLSMIMGSGTTAGQQTAQANNFFSWVLGTYGLPDTPANRQWYYQTQYLPGNSPGGVVQGTAASAPTAPALATGPAVGAGAPATTLGPAGGQQTPAMLGAAAGQSTPAMIGAAAGTPVGR